MRIEFNKILSILLLLMISSGFSNEYHKKQQCKSWSPSKRLKWCDFKGDVPEGNLHSAGSALSIDMKVEQLGILTYQIYIVTCFNPRNSWVRKGAKSRELLYHERLHFDITELYARKLREAVRLSDYDQDGFLEQLQLDYDSISAECSKRQRLYDLETDYSLNRDKQKEWNYLVVEELGLLMDYYEISFKILLKKT